MSVEAKDNNIFEIDLGDEEEEFQSEDEGFINKKIYNEESNYPNNNTLNSDINQPLELHKQEQEEEEEKEIVLDVDELPSAKTAKIIKIEKKSYVDKLVDSVNKKKEKRKNAIVAINDNSEKIAVTRKKRLTTSEKIAKDNKKHTVIRSDRCASKNINKDLQNLFDICSVTSNISGKPVLQSDVLAKVEFGRMKKDKNLQHLHKTVLKDKARVGSTLSNDRINTAKTVLSGR